MLILIGAGLVGFSITSMIKKHYENKYTITHKEPELDLEMVYILENNNYQELEEWRDEKCQDGVQ